jgi:hypothetical protein
MGDYKKNPKVPFEVRVPNKIRKRIAMHETKSSLKLTWGLPKCSAIKKALAVHKKETKQKRGSLWSRFISKVANILQIKPSGVRK